MEVFTSPQSGQASGWTRVTPNPAQTLAVPARAQILDGSGIGGTAPGRKDAVRAVDEPVDHHFGAGSIVADGDVELSRRAAIVALAADMGEGDDINREAVGRREAAAGEFGHHEILPHPLEPVAVEGLG